MKYVALSLCTWDALEAQTPVPLPVAPMGESVGFLLVYDTLEALKRAHPDSDHVVIQEAPVKGKHEG